VELRCEDRCGIDVEVRSNATTTFFARLPLQPRVSQHSPQSRWTKTQARHQRTEDLIEIPFSPFRPRRIMAWPNGKQSPCARPFGLHKMEIWFHTVDITSMARYPTRDRTLISSEQTTTGSSSGELARCTELELRHGRSIHS
jgi:hypothetical protein